MVVVDVETLAIQDVETYLEPVTAPANYKDEAKIAAYILEAMNRQVERAALDIDLAQILSIGVWTEGQEGPIVKTVDDLPEHQLIEWFWDFSIANDLPLVTFNGLGYDVPLLERRSLYLNLPYPALSVDRFRHPDIIDLMQILSFDGKLERHSLDFYCHRFGIKTDEQDISGAGIAQMWLSGDHEGVRRKNRIDVERTTKLAYRIKAIR